MDMQVPFSEVRGRFVDQHPLNLGSNRPALWNLDKANEQFDGKWSYRCLALNEIQNTVLCHHDHWQEESEVQLIPEAGLTVIQAIARYKSLTDYGGTNPLCWQTIEYVKSSDNDIYLSTSPIDTPDFRPLNRFAMPGLFVLDGLHRLIAWGIQGRYSESNLEVQPVNAYIAGEHT